MSSLKDLLATTGLKSYVSQTGLATVLQDLRKNGLLTEPPATRQVIKRLRDEDMCIQTSYGPLFRDIILSDSVRVPIAHPAAMLSHAASTCDTFGSFLFHRAQTIPSTPNNPWHLAIYSDEITLGNPMKTDNRRKVQAMYWSILELGPHHMSSEYAWMFLTMARSHLVNALPAAMSEFAKLALKSFFDPSSDFQRGGILVQTKLGNALLFFKLSVMVGDERALKDTWQSKGASGLLCCFLCRNIVPKSSELDTADATSTLQPSTTLDPRLIIPQTDESLRTAVQMLRDQVGVLGKGAFKDLTRALGINFCPSGLLFDNQLMTHLQPTEMTMYDWMHCYLVSGVFHIEVNLLLEQLSSVHINHTHIHSFLKQFKWPQRLASRSSACKSLFEKHGEFKSNASDALSIYPILRLFLQMHVLPAAQRNQPVLNACDTFFKLCSVLDILRKINHGGNYTPARLSSAVLLHLRKFQDTYGIEPWIPKFHLVTHLAAQLSRNKVLISCFVHERKRKEIKRFGTEVDNTTSFEYGVLKSVVKSHLLALSDDAYFPMDDCCKLLDPRPAQPHVIAAVRHELGGVGSVVNVSFTAYHAPFQQSSRLDIAVVTVDGTRQVAQVWYHLDVDGHALSCVALCAKLGGNRFRLTNEPVLIHTRSICDTCIYRLEGDQFLVAPMQ